jgi:hypothetical protein
MLVIELLDRVKQSYLVIIEICGLVVWYWLAGRFDFSVGNFEKDGGVKPDAIWSEAPVYII